LHSRWKHELADIRPSTRRRCWRGGGYSQAGDSALRRAFSPLHVLQLHLQAAYCSLLLRVCVAHASKVLTELIELGTNGHNKAGLVLCNLESSGDSMVGSASDRGASLLTKLC
jgi:hypothetical protein